MNTLMNNSFLYNGISLNIIYASHIICDSSWKESGVISPFSRMYYVLDGEGYIRTANKTVCLRPGNLYFIPLGTVFDYSCDSRLEKLYLHINLLLDNKLDFFSSLNDIVSVPAEDTDGLLKSFHSNTVFSQIALKTRIYSDLLKIAGESMADYAIIPHSKTVNDALLFINDNLSVKLDIKTVADAVFVSSSLLRKKFSEEMNTSVGKYIDTRIIFEAERMIASGEMSIDSISDRLGFCDRFYFTRRFKEQTGITPGDYKRQMQSQYKSSHTV